MVGIAPDQRETGKRGLATLFVLLLSLFAVSPSAAAAAAAQTNAVLTDIEARAASSVSDASKRAKPTDLLVVLDGTPKVVTRLLYVSPAAARGRTDTSQATGTFRTEYNARAPPAPLI